MGWKKWPYWLKIGIFLSLIYLLWIVWVIYDTKTACANKDIPNPFSDFCILGIFRVDVIWHYFIPFNFLSGFGGWIFVLINFILLFIIPYLIYKLIKKIK